MNEKLDYVEMLEIPINTTSVTFKPAKKRKKRRASQLEEVKEDVIDKVNNEQSETVASQNESESENYQQEENLSESVVVRKKDKKSKKTFSVIALQVALIVVLMGVIAVSNIYIKDSGINTFIKSVFSGTQTTVQKQYSDFNFAIPEGLDVTVNNGVMSYTNKGSIYCLADGTVSKITDENGKKTIEIQYTNKFKSVIKGIDYAYCDLGTTVYSNIPIGYSLGDNIEMCFYNDNAVVTNFKLDGDAIVWQV